MIKRPLALCGFSFFAALLAMNLVEGSLPVLSAAAAIILILCLIVKKIHGREVFAVAMLCVIAAGILFWGFTDIFYDRAMAQAGKEAEFEAVVTGDKEYSSSLSGYYPLKTDDGLKIRLYTDEMQIKAYDRLRIKGYLTDFTGDDEAGRYFKSTGCYLGCINAEEIVEIGREEKTGFAIYRLKRYITGRIEKYLPSSYSGPVNAILTGDKSGLSPEVILNFKSCGLSHILAVSGLHMSIVVFALWRLLTLFSHGMKRAAPIVCIAAAIIYSAVAGFSVSSVRSLITVCTLFAGMLIRRKPDGLNSLGLAALIICAINPYAAMDTSFLFSFSATLGIVLLSGKFNELIGLLTAKIKPVFLRRPVKLLSEIAAVSAVATVFCLPVSILFAGSVSIIFIPSNLLTFFAVPAVLISGLLTALTGPVGKILSVFPGIFCRYILFVTSRLSEVSPSAFIVGTDEMKIWLAVTFITVAAAVLFFKNRRSLRVFCLSFVSLTLVLTCAFTAVSNRRSVRIAVIDSKSPSFIVCSGNKTVLIGSGGNNPDKVLSALEKLGARSISLLLIPTPDDSDYTEVARLKRTYRIEKIVSAAECNAFLYCNDSSAVDDYSHDLGDAKIEMRCGEGSGVCSLKYSAFSVLISSAFPTPGKLLNDNYILSVSYGFPPKELPKEGVDAFLIETDDSSAVPYHNAYLTRDNSSMILTLYPNDEYKIERM